MGEAAAAAAVVQISAARWVCWWRESGGQNPEGTAATIAGCGCSSPQGNVEVGHILRTQLVCIRTDHTRPVQFHVRVVHCRGRGVERSTGAMETKWEKREKGRRSGRVLPLAGKDGK